jgi:hypothetical protein
MNCHPERSEGPAVCRKMQVASLVLSALLLILSAARPAHAQAETVLYNFCSQPNCADGDSPHYQLASDGAGNFYGTTFEGGQEYGVGYGTVFELSPNGSGGWNETVLYTFKGGKDGANPSSGVIFDSAGNLYGTTYYGGSKGNCVVFELSPVKKGWKETVLYRFSGTDGANPANGLILDPKGNLYGTTLNIIVGGDSIVFELSPSEGLWTEQMIYSVNPDVVGLPNGLTMDGDGSIFGTTNFTVFELSPDGSGGWNPTLIHIFADGPKDGAYALGTLALDQAGSLYGVTELGGAHGEQFGGYGTVYKLTHTKKGRKERILYSFKGGTKDGLGPVAGIVFDATGNIYGTTSGGGQFNVGTVFELVARVGKGGYQEKILWSFNETDGSEPFGSLVLDTAGNLYGVTPSGGTSGCTDDSGCGVVFEVTP